METSDYMPKVNTKLANCNLNFVSGPFPHWKKTRKRYGNHQNAEYRILKLELTFFDILRSQVIILEENVLALNKKSEKDAYLRRYRHFVKKRF